MIEDTDTEELWVEMEYLLFLCCLLLHVVLATANACFDELSR